LRRSADEAAAAGPGESLRSFPFGVLDAVPPQRSGRQWSVPVHLPTILQLLDAWTNLNSGD